MVSATQRTLKLLRDQGHKCWIVEHWNPHANVRVDLFNIIDIIVLDKSRGVLGVQTTVGSSNSAHMKKLLVEKRDDTKNWLETPGTFLELWSWRELKVKRGMKRTKWEPLITCITLDMLEGGSLLDL